MQRSSIVCVLLTSLLSSWPCTGERSASEARREAVAAEARGDATGALKAWQQASQAEPLSGELKDRIGFLLAVLQRNAEASLAFRRAIQLEPNLASAHFHLGIASGLEQDYTTAIPELQTAVRLEPTSAEYRYRLGCALSDVRSSSRVTKGGTLRFKT
jgi:Flp pilus assembly protein TadD